LPATEWNAYFTRIITEFVLPEVKPTLLVFWHTDPDHTSHARGHGAAETRQSLRDADTNLGTILDARHVILVATGAQKAQAVRDLAEGPVAAICAASVLQLHPHATILLDEAAASSLRLADYYRHSYDHKPAWQGL